jgi:hypothetical protein
MNPRHPQYTPESKLERKQAEAEVESEVLETAVGAVAGAITGALAGPIGVAVGAGIGAAAGAALGHQIRNANRERAQHDRDLDDGIVEEPVLDEMPGRDALELATELELPSEREHVAPKIAPPRDQS